MSRELAREHLVERRQQRRRDERRRREDHGVGRRRPGRSPSRASGRHRGPPAPRACAAGSRPPAGAAPVASTSAAHAVGRRDEHPVARPAAAARDRRRRPEPEDDAAVLALQLEESRHGGRERQPFGVRGVDAADERIGDALERLAAEPAAHERGEALVAGVAAPRGSTRSSAMRSLPATREQRRASRAARGPSAPAGGSPPAAAARRPSCDDAVRRSPGRVPTRRSAMPRRSHSATPQGFSVMIESAPRSRTKPPVRTLRDRCRRAGRPPRAGSRRAAPRPGVLDEPVRRREAGDRRRPPRARQRRSRRGRPDHVRQHADEARVIVHRRGTREAEAAASRRWRAPRRRGRRAPRRDRRRSRRGRRPPSRAPSGSEALAGSPFTSGSSHGSRGLPLRLW